VRHILSLLLENEAGALSSVSGLFSARAFNIESLTVAVTEDPSMSRMTIVTVGSDEIIEQITKQLNKLVDVIKVVDLNESTHIERELMLIKVSAEGEAREEVKRLVEIFRGRIIDVTDKLEAFIEALNRKLIKEVVRTGVSGIGRGDKAITI
jgi:acetolactate synthase-1/3 small subunit